MSEYIYISKFMSWNAIVGITRSKVIMMVGLTMMCWLQLNINSINHCKPWHCHLAVLKRFRVEPELIDFPSAYCWDLVICPPSFEHPPGQLWAMCMCWNLVPSVPIRNVNSIVCLGMLINYFWGLFGIGINSVPTHTDTNLYLMGLQVAVPNSIRSFYIRSIHHLVISLQ